MRGWKLPAASLLAAVLFVPWSAQAQVSATIHFGAPQRSWGHEVVINPYAAERYGDWHKGYRHWTPVTLYVADGHYYPHRIRGARAVTVYRYHNQYFFPPRETGWDHLDHRYNYANRPTDEDYNRPPPPHQ